VDFRLETWLDVLVMCIPRKNFKVYKLQLFSSSNEYAKFQKYFILHETQ